MLGFFFCSVERKDILKMKKYVCGCLDKGEAIGHGEIWCNEISFKDGSYHKRLGCIQTFPYTVFGLQEETHQMFRDL